MRFFSILLVLGATIVGLLWAAQYDYGPVVINQADEYRLVLRLGVPQPELIEPGIAMTGSSRHLGISDLGFWQAVTVLGRV